MGNPLGVDALRMCHEVRVIAHSASEESDGECVPKVQSTAEM
jgi:hypothetical protein